MNLTTHELEILKAALECDMLYQEKQLEKLNDKRFSLWLKDTKKLYQRVNNELSVARTKDYLQGDGKHKTN